MNSELIPSLCSLVFAQELTLVVSSLLTIFESRVRALDLVLCSIRWEIEECNEERLNSLFRSNTPASKWMTKYALKPGGDGFEFLRRTLKPPLDHFFSTVDRLPQDPPLEVNPSRVKSSDVAANAKLIMQFSQDFFDRIINSADSCPRLV